MEGLKKFAWGMALITPFRWMRASFEFSMMNKISNEWSIKYC